MMKMTTEENIRRGQIIFTNIRRNDRVVFLADTTYVVPPGFMPIGIAARDIPAMSEIEYDPLRNTKDITIKIRFSDVLGDRG